MGPAEEEQGRGADQQSPRRGLGGMNRPHDSVATLKKEHDAEND